MNASQLGPTEKTAILMLALGEELAAEIFRNMNADEVKKIGAALNRLGRVSQQTIDLVLKEFHQIIKSDQPDLLTGNFEFTKSVLEKAFKGSAQGQTIIAELSKSEIRMSAVEIADAETIYRVISSEHPQTIALVLAHAGPEKAGAIARKLPEGLRTEVIQRVSRLDHVAPEVVQEVDDLIRVEIERMGSASRVMGGADKAAAILNAMNPEGRDEVLDRLADNNPDLESEIRSHMFTFADLVQLDDHGVRELHKHIKQDMWVLALRGAPQAVMDLILANMSSRAGQNLKEDMESSGPKPIKDVRAAQKEVIEKVLQLVDQGKIFLGSDTDQVV